MNVPFVGRITFGLVLVAVLAYLAGSRGWIARFLPSGG